MCQVREDSLMTWGNGATPRHLGDWTCDCGRTESGYRSTCKKCGTHVTERDIEQ